MTYTVALVDCTDAISDGDRSAVVNQLTMWLTAADSTRPASARSGATVTWTTSVPAPTTYNLVIYFVADYRHSVLRHMRRFHAPSHWNRLNGLTYFYDDVRWVERAGVRTYTRDEHLGACEVYRARCPDAAALAMFAFHEAMHGQLRMSNELHVDPTAGGGIAAAALLPGTTPTQSNLSAFGAAMETVRPEWVDGYSRSHPTQATHPLHPHH